MPASLPPALAAILGLLRCPTCRASLRPRSARPPLVSLGCPAGHTFDLARQGYVSLLAGTRATSGDDPAQVRARERFLATGACAPVREAVADLAADALASTDEDLVVDVGCGTGYYLAGVLDQQPQARGLGLDIAVRALRVAARAHPRAAASWDVFRAFPLRDQVADVVLDVFAPRNPSEFHRVLRPTGRLVVVRPAERHLAELRGQVPGMVMVDPVKEQRLHQALNRGFEALETRRVEYVAPLTRQEAVDLVEMTPSARHLSQADLDGPLPDQVTVSLLASAYQPCR